MSQKMEYLFKPGQIGTLKVKNRVVFSPCETLYATVDGQVTQRIIDYYVRRAEGGAGLLMTHTVQGCTKIDTNDPFAHSLRIDDNAYVPMLSELTEAVHRAGAKIAVLVSPGSGAQSMGFPYDRGLQGITEPLNVGASERMSNVAQRKVRRLSADEIKTLVKVYGLAAGRAKTAGFDALVIHALGGYLVAQFLSPLFNDRTDAYGGSLEGRMRLLLELIESCRQNAGPNFPIIVRMSIDEFVDGGRGVAESVKMVKRLEEAGVNAIDAHGGIYDSMHFIIPPVFLPKGVLVELAAAVKAEARIPVIAQGRLYDPEVGESVLREGKADFIGMARGLLADPDWVNKVQEGRVEELRRCTSCNQCIGRIFMGLPVRCAVNPTVGRESQFGGKLPKAEKPKKVCIVGAGPAGMEAARVAAERGHKVKLFEKTGELGGGQFRLATLAPYKDEFKNIVRYYESQFKKMKNVEVVLNKEVDAATLEKEKPDAVILATGGRALVPDIRGADLPHVMTNHGFLGAVKPLSGRVVVAGGGCAGVGTADLISDMGTADVLSDLGLDVTVVEMTEQCALDEELITRLTLLHRLQSKGNVKLLTNHRIKEITEKGVLVTKPEGEDMLLPADHVILAFGAVPHNPLAQVASKLKDCQVIGDSVQPRKILHAIEDGFFAGLKV
jgi:2,4-dienoyl-CoA reductase-like NADH-dependent reductase (Old Yellow Enzyme family)/thioredoxin reductase